MTASVTFVVPYYNEAGYIGRTLESLALQSCSDFHVVAVDNASGDSGPAEARAVAARYPGLSIEFIEERQPGKIHALKAGIARATTRYVGTLDADTIYPPDYVARCLALFARKPGTVCVLAFAAEGRADAPPRLVRQARLLPGKCHSGGCGQTFLRVALEQAGGFDADRWGWVLEDHEIIHRVGKLGRLAYDPPHLCFPADRRSDRSGCSWTLGERIAYKLLPGFAMDWFFYRFLAGRFARRGLANLALRSREWDPAQPASA